LEDSLQVVLDAIDCKIPSRVPSFCLGADWDFMERYYAEIGFTYGEFQQFKADKLPWLCPCNIPLSIKLGVDLTWITIGGPVIWLEHSKKPAQMHGGLFKIATRKSSYNPPKNSEKMPIPHWWWLKEGLEDEEAIRLYLEKDLHYKKSKFKDYKKIIDICLEKYGLVVSIGLTGPWENLHFGIGFGQIAKLWRKNRELLYELVDFHSEFALEGMKYLMKITKPKVVMIGDDYGYNSGLQLSKEMWRKLVRPTLEKHAEIIHSHGGKFLLHSCGNIGELFGDFVEIGIDAVESLKPFNNDLKALKQKYGDDIALVGTIDDTNLLKNGSPEQVRQEVTKSINQLGPGGYIPGATNFLLDQPPNNVVAMIDAIKNYQL
jgi:uroporphyrinogen-III decarboxylase